MWLDQFEFAGFYVAKEKGFYEKAGIDVELKKFDNSINVLNEVMENKADWHGKAPNEEEYKMAMEELSKY